MPTHADRGMCAPRHRAMRAAQTGWVATRAVDDATVVNRSDGIQVAKCSPRSSPDDPISHHSPTNNPALAANSHGTARAGPNRPSARDAGIALTKATMPAAAI